MSLALLPEEQLFVDRLYDWVDGVEKHQRPQFSAFLNEREQQIVKSLLPSLPWVGIMFGGYEQAQRQMLALHPSWYDLTKEDFPVEVVAISHMPSDTLNHRDVLGSLIGLGLARDTVGDILPQAGICYVLVTRPVFPVVLENLKRIGRIGVRVQPGDFSALFSVQEYVEKRGTVSSLRLDCLVSLLTGLSRDKGADLFRQEHVQRNYVVERSLFAPFKAEDIITIRGYGKFIVDCIGAPTRKNRLPIVCRKYK